MLTSLDTAGTGRALHRLRLVQAQSSLLLVLPLALPEEAAPLTTGALGRGESSDRHTKSIDRHTCFSAVLRTVDRELIRLRFIGRPAF